jgi:CO/xanthine dehydrogenase FAD-binding subunit
MGLPPVDYHCPSSIDEAVQLLDTLGDGALVLAGGTDVIPQLRRDTFQSRALVEIGRLPGLDSIEISENELRIGALTTHAQIAASAALREGVPALAAACRSVAAPPVRNRGTVGGNLANASPAADSAPPLLAMDARVHLVTSQRRREVPLAEFFIGPGETILKQGELITAISMELPNASFGSTFLKYGNRTEMAIAVASIAVGITLAEDNEQIADVRIALGSVAPTPMRAREAEELLRGTDSNAALIKQAAIRAAEATQPISDIRASADYRRRLTSVLVERALAAALDRARGEGGSLCTKCA